MLYTTYYTHDVFAHKMLYTRYVTFMTHYLQDMFYTYDMLYT